MGGIDIERLMAKTRPSQKCWDWMGAKTKEGYGKCRRKVIGGGRVFLAHRAMYYAMCGNIPEGLELDHLCRNTSCVNPEHLEPVTRTENIRRAYAARTEGAFDYCHLGHYRDGYVPSGRRYCRVCVSDRARNAREARNAKILADGGQLKRGGRPKKRTNNVGEATHA